jgi:sodium transport system permease protein
MRSALRERNIVINSLLIPLLLYPFLLWLGFTGITFVGGQTEGHRSRVHVSGWPEGHGGMRLEFERNEQIRLITDEGSEQEDWEARLRQGTLDAWVELAPAAGEGAALEGNFEARLRFDASKERGELARERVESVLSDYRERWLRREAEGLGIEPGAWQVYLLGARNMASERQVGAFILGLLLPLFFVIAVAVGCFYPAVDATAGERERGTWETLMSTGANRFSVAAAKYAFVASMGCVAGLLNLGAMAITMKPLFGALPGGGLEAVVFRVPWVAIPVIVLGAVLLGAFIAGGMLLLAMFARTFKEGQALVTPFFMLLVLPMLFLQVPGLEFSLALAWVPVVNVVMMIRTALMGEVPWLSVGVTVLVSVTLIAACVRMGAYILQFEDVVMEPHGGLKTFLRRRIFRRL